VRYLRAALVALFFEVRMLWLMLFFFSGLLCAFAVIAGFQGKS
jgi:hypothetical protein